MIRAYLGIGHLLRPARIGPFRRSFRLHSCDYARETIAENDSMGAALATVPNAEIGSKHKSDATARVRVLVGLLTSLCAIGVAQAALAPNAPIASRPANSSAAAASAPAASQSATTASNASPEETAEIVVTGVHEGPRLWKVSKAGHVLWILGTVSPLPKKMVWQSEAVQDVLAQSQEVVPGWPQVGIGANPFTALRTYLEWRRIQKTPDKVKLKDALPPPLYARFSALKARYDAGDGHIEELRPMLAAGRLMEKALDASGLALRNEVQQTVIKLAKSRGVRIHQDKLKIEDPVDVLKDVNEASRASEIACMDAIVTRLETDLGPMQARARAWALGDVDLLRKLPHPDDRSACLEAVSTSDRVKSLLQKAQNDWMTAVEDSLARNPSTLAVQSMDRLLGENGTLAALKTRGYEVEGP